MKQKVKDGIFLDNIFYISEEKKEGFPYHMRIIQYLVILAGGWSAASTLIGSFSIPVSTKWVYLGLFLSSVIFYVLFYSTKLDIIKLVFTGGFYFLFLFSRLKFLKNGFYILENLFLDRAEDYYNVRTYRFLADYATEKADTTLLVVMILIPVMALLSMAIIRNRFISLCNLILFLPVCASFAFGIIPPELHLVTWILVVLYLTRSYPAGRRSVNKEQKELLARINSRAAVWLTLLCLSLFFLMKLFVSPKKYDGVTEIDASKAKLQSFLYSFSITDVTNKLGVTKIKGGSAAAGGLSGGKLGDVDKVVFNQSKQLLITAPLSAVEDGLYLKGYVGSTYNGSSWTGFDDETAARYRSLLDRLSAEDFVPGNQSSEFIRLISQIKDNDDYRYSVDEGKIKVTYLNADKSYRYTPYYSDYSGLKNIKYREDLYAVPTKKSSTYELDFFYRFNADVGAGPAIAGQLKNYTEGEKLYRDFVYDTYTRLPDEGLERLKQDFSPFKETIDNTMDKINYVRAYLNSRTRYSLSPGRLPKGKDFVEYFLYENQTGYCSYYASAATLMLRAMGVPARYVEGYAIGADNINRRADDADQEVKIFTDQRDSTEQTPQVELTVKDWDAHAWVEVYIDGSGWVPMEFTPATSIADTDRAAQQMITAGGDKDPGEPTLTPTPKPTATPRPTKAPEVTKDKEQPDKEKTSVPTASLGVDKHTEGLFLWLVLVFVTAAAGLFVVFFLMHRRKAQMYSDNPNKRVLHIYGRTQRLFAFCHVLPKKGGLEDQEAYIRENCSYIEAAAFDSFMETARKARFGRYRIGSQELLEAESFQRRLFDEIYQRSHFVKRIYLKLCFTYN